MYKFGDGLSYNTFNYSMASTNAQTVLKGAVVDTIGDKYHNDLIAAKQSEHWWKSLRCPKPWPVQQCCRSCSCLRSPTKRCTRTGTSNQISTMVRASSLYDRRRCCKVCYCPEGERFSSRTEKRRGNDHPAWGMDGERPHQRALRHTVIIQ